MCFFFQAEDGIRDWSVTGVQTCALPISSTTSATCLRPSGKPSAMADGQVPTIADFEKLGVFYLGKQVAPEPSGQAFLYDSKHLRSEERRVGKECRSRGSR